jgi:hypothetical protein
VIDAIVLIAMVAGVGASGLLVGWITVPALVFGLIFWNVGADAVIRGAEGIVAAAV